MGSQLYPSFSPDGKQVAFEWDGEKGDNWDIYVQLIGDTHALRLTTDPATDHHPAWSPDGKRIAFLRSNASGPLGIYTVSALGGPEQKLSDLRAVGQMSWSPDGKWLAVASPIAESAAIFLLPAEGGEPRRLSNPKAPGYDWVPSFSPDGRQLAYASCVSTYSACEVYLQELDANVAPRGAPRRITQQGISIGGLTWSRDGKAVIYAASQGLGYLWRVAVHDQRPPQRLETAGPNAFDPSIAPAGNRLVFDRRLPRTDIWRYHVGGGVEPLIASASSDASPQFSPDGKRIAFKSDRSGEQFEIWLAEADGSRPVQLTNRLGRNQAGPSWSPDGRWIAFSSQREDGHVGICAIEASGGTPRRLSFEGTDEAVPSWSPDGKWIYFRSNRTGRNEIWRLPFSGGPPIQVTENGGFFPYASPDGKTLFYQKEDQSSSCCGPPLSAKSLSGGPERQVLPSVYVRAFEPVEDGIYYIGSRGDDGKYPLQFLQFSTNASRLLTKIDNPVTQSISVSPDRKTILFGRGIPGANLFMVENFR